MATTVEIARPVHKQIKRLRRRYPSLTTELAKVISQLETDERPGDKIPGVGHDVYKVRLANPSAQRGKSGGFRVIYYVKTATGVIIIAAYSKSDQTDISPDAIRRAIEEL